LSLAIRWPIRTLAAPRLSEYGCHEAGAIVRAARCAIPSATDFAASAALIR
jgi:hypothetical protein